MKKHHFIVLVLLGIFLIPGNVIACASGKDSCKKEISKAKTEKKSCCESDNKSNNDDKGCKGNCGHSKCGCAAVSNSFSVVSDIIFKNNSFDFSAEKQKYCNAETFISSGFYSIWLIPKIS